MAKPVWTNTQITNQLDSGSHWTGNTLTYSFPTSASWFPYGERSGFTPLTSAQQAAATMTVRLWDDLMAPDFQQVGGNTPANIEYMNTTTNIGYAHAYFPGGWQGAGSVWFNSQYGASSGTNNLMSPTVGAWGWSAYVHETGHALGLDHPGAYNGGSPTYANDALYVQDSQMYTIMSYFSASNTGADWYASDGRLYYAQTPMLHDIMAIQAMYGAETTTRTGNTTYGFNATADAWVFDFTQNQHPVVCIFDSAGIDTLDLSGWSYSCSINLAPGSFSNADMMTYNISIAYGAWIENGVGGGGNDSLLGSQLANQLSGLAGGDTLSGLAGDDVLVGGAGNDNLDGGAGSDTAVYSGTRADYAVIWNASTSTFTLIDTRNGSPDGQDQVTNVENFEFSDGVVTAANLLNTGGGGGSGTTGTAAADVLNGTASADQILGFGANDSLIGLGGDDLLDGGVGADTMWGGTGNDVYVVDAAGDVVIENANDGTDLVNTTLASYTLGNNVERLTYTGASTFAGTGNGLANILTGGDGADTLSGLAGDDSLIGNAGADTMRGGTGNDVYAVDATGDVVIENANEGTDLVNTTLASYRLASNVERLTYTGASTFAGTGNDLANILTGGDGADTLSGSAGDDTLIGNAGADTLNGGSGYDTMRGGTGDDVYVVDAARDSVIEAANEGTDLVNTTLASYTLGNNVENLTNTGGSTFAGTGNSLANILTGGRGADTLSGQAGDDWLIGNAGADTLIGGSGADTMWGGIGNDVYVVDSTSDVVVENANEGTDLVETTLVSYTLGNDVERLTYTGTSTFAGTGNGLENVLTGGRGADTLSGLAGNDTLIGNAGADVLIGGSGADVLIGGAGADTLTGGSEADIFRFLVASDSGRGRNADVIADFNHNQGDRIDLSGIDARPSTTSRNDAFSFIGSANFNGIAGELRFVGETLYADLNGDRVADFEIILTGVTSLTSADLIL